MVPKLYVFLAPRRKFCKFTLYLAIFFKNRFLEGKGKAFTLAVFQSSGFSIERFLKSNLAVF